MDENEVKITGKIFSSTFAINEQGTVVPGEMISVGLPLRDLFAAFALAGLIAQTDRAMPVETFAKEAFSIADAALKVREEAK